MISILDDRFGDLLAEPEADNGGPIVLAAGESFTFDFTRELTLLPQVLTNVRLGSRADVTAMPAVQVAVEAAESAFRANWRLLDGVS